MKKIGKIVLFSLLGVILVIAIGVGGLCLYSHNYTIPEQAASIENLRCFVLPAW